MRLLRRVTRTDGPLIAQGACRVRKARDVGVVVVAGGGEAASFGEHLGVVGGSAVSARLMAAAERGGSAGLGGVAGERFGDGLGEPARRGGDDAAAWFVAGFRAHECCAVRSFGVPCGPPLT